MIDALGVGCQKYAIYLFHHSLIQAKITMEVTIQKPLADC